VGDYSAPHIPLWVGMEGLGVMWCTLNNVARQIAPHVASVNASIKQHGKQCCQPHVEQSVKQHAS